MTKAFTCHIAGDDILNPETRSICSRGGCFYCLGDRLAGMQDEYRTLTAENERLKREIENIKVFRPIATERFENRITALTEQLSEGRESYEELERINTNLERELVDALDSNVVPRSRYDVVCCELEQAEQRNTEVAIAFRHELDALKAENERVKVEP